MAIFIKGFR